MGCMINNTCNNLGPRLLWEAGFSISQPVVGGNTSRAPEVLGHLPRGHVEHPSGKILDPLRCGRGTKSVCHSEENILGSRKELLYSLRAESVSLSAEAYSFSTAPQAPKDI